MLVAVGAIDVAALAYLWLFPIVNSAVYWLSTIYFGGMVIGSFEGLRLKKRNYSVTAIFWFIATILVFDIWNLLLLFARGLLFIWWHAPVVHLGVVAALGLVPLAFAIWQLRRMFRMAR